jgi:hypothetical protein
MHRTNDPRITKRNLSGRQTVSTRDGSGPRLDEKQQGGAAQRQGCLPVGALFPRWRAPPCSCGVAARGCGFNGNQWIRSSDAGSFKAPLTGCHRRRSHSPGAVRWAGSLSLEIPEVSEGRSGVQYDQKPTIRRDLEEIIVCEPLFWSVPRHKNQLTPGPGGFIFHPSVEVESDGH